MNKDINNFTNLLYDKKLTLALAESVTCGLASHKLATAPGTSDVLKGSIICYTPEVKMRLLGISKKMIRKHTTESMQVTTALAKNLRKLIKADIHAAITGLASADGSETKDKPVGTTFFCFRYRGRNYKMKKVFRGTPLEIKEKAAMSLFEFISKKIK